MKGGRQGSKMVKNPVGQKRGLEGEPFVRRRAWGMRVEKNTRPASRNQTAHGNCVPVSRAFRKAEVQPELVFIRIFERERR